MSTLTEEERKKELNRAHSMALRLLSARSYSVNEIRNRLNRNKIPLWAIEEEIQKLLNLNLLDDTVFARERAASLARRGMGPAVILARLLAVGIDFEEAKISVDKAVESLGGEKMMAEAIAEKRYGNISELEKKQREKAARFLIRRGFRSPVATEICRVYSEDSRDDVF